MQGMDLSPVGLFLEASLVGKAVMAVLFVASLWCWVLIIEGVISVVRIRRAVRQARAGGGAREIALRRRNRRRRGSAPPHSGRDGRRTEVAHLGRDGARGARALDAIRGRAAQSRRHLLGCAVRRPVRHRLGHHVELRRHLPGAGHEPRYRRARHRRSRWPRPPMVWRRRFPPRSATTVSARPTPGSGRRWPRSSRSARSRCSPVRPKSRATTRRAAERRRPDGDEARARSARAFISRWPRSTSRRSST